MKTYIILFVLFLISFEICSQTYFEDINFAFEYNKIEKRTHDYPEIARFYPFSDGHGVYADLSKLKSFPRTIAVVSFVIWDQSIVIKNQSPQTIWSGKDWVVDNENMVAYAMNKFGMPYIKDVFDSNDVKIITPDQFNEAQFNAYASFNLEYSINYKKYVSDTIQLEVCSSPGYRFFKKPVNELDTKASNQLGQLAENLGVDAVLLIENTIETTPYFGVLKRIDFSLYGMNPNYHSSNKDGKMLKGMHYLTSQIDVNAIFCQYDKGEKVYENYAGYDKYVTLLSNHLLHEFEFRQKIQPKLH